MLPDAAAVAANPFDGTYVGQRSITRGTESACGRAGSATLTVADGHVSREYGHATITSAVGPDGSFSASAQYMLSPRVNTARIEGRISGEALEADVEGYACKFHYSLKKT
jgi:hypothetical protein